MINIFPVWEKGLFGKGIRVRVNDDGEQYCQNDFASGQLHPIFLICDCRFDYNRCGLFA